MKKSIYSLVLADDVIAAIDRMAYQQGTSRSNLVNQLLAERLSLMTPEMRFRDIFRSMEQILDQSIQVLSRSSDTMLQLRSPLRFKYNPTIRYQLTLNRENAEAIGTLMISFRTTSRGLIDMLDAFFEYWIRLEQQFTVPFLGHGIRYRKEDGRLTRELYYPANRPAVSGEEAGEAIGDYIRLLDACLKAWFLLAEESPEQQRREVARLTRTYLSGEDVLIV